MASQNIGGQAVIEGVMMRDRQKYSIAVRLPDGKIESVVKDIKEWNPSFSKPFLRGIKGLVENLQIGYRSLHWSADKQDPAAVEKKKGLASFLGSIVLLLSVAIAVGLFIVLPNLAVHFLGLIENDQPLLFNLASGGVRLFIFFAYIFSISYMKDIKRLFQYHGAEHKVIHTFEKNLPLTIENIKPHSTLHKRCGTSFIFLLIFVAILAFSVVPPLLKIIFTDYALWSIYLQKTAIFLAHILFLPVLASVSYEVLKVSAKENWVGKLLVIIAYPGLLFQKITTSEPDAPQIEVAVASLNVLLAIREQENKEDAASQKCCELS